MTEAEDSKPTHSELKRDTCAGVALLPSGLAAVSNLERGFAVLAAAK